MTPPTRATRKTFKNLHNHLEKSGKKRLTDTWQCVDYSLNNPDTLTKYKNAATISQKVLEAVTAMCVAGEKIVTICEKGDKLLEEEIAKVYRGKKMVKGEQNSLCIISPYC